MSTKIAIAVTIILTIIVSCSGAIGQINMTELECKSKLGKPIGSDEMRHMRQWTIGDLWIYASFDYPKSVVVLDSHGGRVQKDKSVSIFKSRCISVKICKRDNIDKNPQFNKDELKQMLGWQGIVVDKIVEGQSIWTNKDIKCRIDTSQTNKPSYMIIFAVEKK
jgi:uncharacterized protein YneF (UPF0154 family)